MDLSNDPIFPIFHSPLQGFKNTAALSTLTLKSMAPGYRQEQRKVGKLPKTLWGISKSAEATAGDDSGKIHSPFQRGEIHCMSTLYRPVFPPGEAKGRKETPSRRLSFPERRPWAVWPVALQDVVIRRWDQGCSEMGRELTNT